MKNSDLKQRITLSVKIDSKMQDEFGNIAKTLNISKASLLRVMVAEALSCTPQELAKRLFTNQVPAKRGRPKSNKNKKEPQK